MEALLEGMQRNEQGSGGFLTSCEAELQELMKQIDIMVAHKKSEWETQTQALEACLSVREQELASARAALQEKYKEVGMLRHQVEDIEKAKQDMVKEYEQQLKKFQEELSRLRRSYEKLQKKQLREARGEANKRQGDDQFEISRLTRKLEEFRQKSLDWEKQRLLYQQQVASLEAQRKALAEQSELIQQTQLANRKQILESVELASRSEIQHLTSKLERANDAICANELEVERLNMVVDDLTVNNRMILEDQQRVQEELRQSKKMLEVLQDEKMELRATLQSQEDFIDSSKLHQEQLQKELARLTETLHTKELLNRALEEHLQEKQLSSPGLELEHILLQLDVAQKKEQHLQSEVTHLENSLVSSNARCVQLSEELDENIKELQSMEEHHTESKAEIKKLKEQLIQAEQTHSSELEGMKREISRLTQELHQRDITIASASGSTSDLEQRLRTEIERAERKAVEHRVILVQLETLRLENRHLSEMLETTECGMLEGKDVTLRAFSEDYAVELNKLKSENQQLRKDLAEARAKLELTWQVCQDEPEGIAQQMQDEEPEARDVQYRTTWEAQHKHDEQAERIYHKPDGTVQHHQGEPQRWGAAEVGTVTPEMGELPTQTTKKNCMESLALGALLGTDSLLHVLDGNKDFADEASKQSISNHQRESVPSCPLPTASVGSIAARYLEEEELRSQRILECLNAHIEELKKESEKIVRQFGHQE
ncbi:centrosomal protein of 63 kDa isoform X1 [Aquila chrysaetos chrysaetos]|uniref:centrosomal protein of 63 kDa isoform X1 n=2 Tax=Aquila chrysaetos chrysaetos TaxID=223781 RepID=UPI0005D0723C|nr:centrosomal protein of 63 kDa isoform X1 [Aquila chrysaetos chrysaetos]XP_029885235.1 centrosomal protein of 63 kDa isoform X1 [Aquila chrysaetos chrysaetos]XP_029885236.1 centrosomal protein of 63 kDa isoform X1 [Aquila chrysaetos chrysaetos]XP_029885240.1 centrosomal protein of 63 kDa isoform X1 [Aquila chrysaetos chrysaetos]XP_029885241.1 centrosomal protein of 63 kDa isoform X1 [Aquila chrysaetos chrysaetos]XP_040982966.1 centrosomal protein of 63 kDa isoform X1 [Aquila chrysaetos chrys